MTPIFSPAVESLPSASSRSRGRSGRSDPTTADQAAAKDIIANGCHRISAPVSRLPLPRTDSVDNDAACAATFGRRQEGLFGSAEKDDSVVEGNAKHIHIVKHLDSGRDVVGVGGLVSQAPSIDADRLGTSGGKGENDALVVSDGNSSESESVSGGDSSDGCFSADEREGQMEDEGSVEQAHTADQELLRDAEKKGANSDGGGSTIVPVGSIGCEAFVGDTDGRSSHRQAETTNNSNKVISVEVVESASEISHLTSPATPPDPQGAALTELDIDRSGVGSNEASRRCTVSHQNESPPKFCGEVTPHVKGVPMVPTDTDCSASSAFDDEDKDTIGTNSDAGWESKHDSSEEKYYFKGSRDVPGPLAAQPLTAVLGGTVGNNYGVNNSGQTQSLLADCRGPSVDRNHRSNSGPTAKTSPPPQPPGAEPSRHVCFSNLQTGDPPVLEASTAIDALKRISATASVFTVDGKNTRHREGGGSKHQPNRPSEASSSVNSSIPGSGQPRMEPNGMYEARPTAKVETKSVGDHFAKGCCAQRAVVKSQATSRHRYGLPTSTPPGSDIVCDDGNSQYSKYADFFPRFAAILSAHHNGRALTRETDGRSLPLTSSIMARSRGAAGGRGRGGRSGLTAAEEEACLQWQWKLYAVYVRVIKVRQGTI